LIVLAMVISVFGVRLFQLQGLDPKAYAAKADAEGLVTVPLPATRGSITDRNGVPLAESVSGLMIVGDPKRTDEHAEEIARILANRLDLDYFDVLTRLRIDPDKPGSRFAYVARRVPATLARSAVAAIDKAGYKGIDTRLDPVRDYPAGDVAANLLGYLKADGQADSGGGLERSFDQLLSGKDGSETYEVGGGNRIPLGENTEIKPVNGKDLTLTIDRDVQWYAQRVLRTAVQGARAQSGAAVALDTQTGEILALADYPTYDANKASDAPEADLGSRALSDVYEPGSVEKVLTMSGLLDKGLVKPTTRVRVPHQLPVADRVIHDYFEHDLIRLTLAGVIAKSSNIGTVLAARQYQPGQLWHYLDLFGLGHRTDIGMPGETRGLLPDPSTWTELTQATASFGQGVSVNALQMAAAVNAVANGGEFISPSLVEGRAVTSSGDAVGTATATRHRVISPDAAAKVSRMMEMVTTEGAGTAPGAGIAGYRVAGKTGTAQQVGAKCRCYDGSLAVSFAGFAPADNPRFTVYVVIQKPQGSASGGGTAGPVFRKILTYLLQKYAVPPTNTRPAHLPVEW
jgi:cell division protein FtsI (penicillin-binding protein 3)